MRLLSVGEWFHLNGIRAIGEASVTSRPTPVDPVKRRLDGTFEISQKSFAIECTKAVFCNVVFLLVIYFIVVCL